MNNFWDQKYSSNEMVYGETPNEFFKEQLLKLKHGNILLPGEGEGRNAVYAALSGWNVTALDSSTVARNKAMRFAAKHKVSFEYILADINTYQAVNLFDCVGLLYIYLPSVLRHDFHKKIIQSIKPGGVLMMEAFSKEQSKNQSGGPKDLDMLYSLIDISSDFSSMHIKILQHQIIFLDEGEAHSGKADVIRLIALK